MAPVSDRSTGPASAQEAFDQASALQQEGRLAEAEKLYAAALALDPQHGETLIDLGLLFLQQNRSQESIALLRQATARRPTSAEAHTHLGAALHKVGSVGEALACHERALALAPDYADARFRRAFALQALGRLDEAIAGHEDLLADEPEIAQFQLGLATALTAAGRDGEAFVHYRNAARLDPRQAPHLQNALDAYAQRHPADAQAGMQRLNRYIGGFLTNHGAARMGVYPGLTSKPFHEPGRFPGALALERNSAAIRREIEALAAAEYQPEAEGLKDRGAWDVFLFYERGRKNEANCARCPVITRTIEGADTVRTTAGLLYVSKLSPGAHIKPHRGPTNLRLRCHLGIRVPTGNCALKVGGEIRPWREGRCLVFDDSLEHEAWNNTADPRVVLIVDFWHPDLTPAETAYLEGLHRFAAFQAESLNRYWSANAGAQSRAGNPGSPQSLFARPPAASTHSETYD